MAEPDHVALVLKGADSIDKWRERNPEPILNLGEANLSGADLSGANLSWSYLHTANLTDARLQKARLYKANLSFAKLRRANLIEADLCRAQLNGAVLSRANLARAKFYEANLSGADLLKANLSGADLATAFLRHTRLRDADLSSTNLQGTTFLYVDTDHVKFTLARMGGTTFVGCNLARCKEVETIIHETPSHIDFSTIQNSFRALGSTFTSSLETLFLNSGIPFELMSALPQVLAEIRYRSCFICYGEPDRAFAERLVRDLKARGVSCWLYSMDYTPGERTWKEITKARRQAEKMIVMCSAESLIRDGVKKEIEEQIDEDPNKMIPISLDNLWKQDGFLIRRGQRDLKPFLLDKNYADVSDESKYNNSICKLLRGLRRMQM